MGKRGPKPVDVDLLRQLAYACAITLYRLRDGQPGLLAKVVRPKPLKPILTLTRVVHWSLFIFLAPEAEVGFPVRSTKGEVIVVAVVLPEMANHVRRLVRNQRGWILTPPIPPRPQVWERLKEAHSVADVRQFVDKLHKRFQMINEWQWEALRSGAQDLLSAKRLTNYPDSDRQRSDDKRIQFWSKVLAGSLLGIAPATATKRLSHLPLPTSQELNRRWAEYETSLSRARKKEKRK